MTLTVAIVGRPNVGKSTLFNRLTGRRTAIVHDLPGVTRDRREGDAQVGDLFFRLIDTAGLEDESDLSTTEGRMRAQTDVAMRSADVILMMVDARAGVTPLDAHFADLLRRQDKPVILVANKCEGRVSQPGLFEAFGLGLGEPVPVSSEHGEGMGGLYEALRPYADAADPPADPDAEPAAAESGDDEAVLAARPLSLAIVGRPNVGKSTLVNRLLGEERMLTGPEAGLTRDAITSAFEWRGRPLTLVDTAGLRRKARIEESLEKLSAQDTLNAVRMAAVVALVLDANAVLEKQDLTIARHVIDEGRALVVIVNKWDIADDKGEILERLKDRLANALPQVRGIPFVTVSALKGHGMDRMMETVFSIYDTWNRRVPTRPLNEWLKEMTERHPPPLGGLGRRLRVRYITQAKIRPPTFVAFVSRAADMPDSYARYLVNGLRDAFGLDGIPIRLHLRQGKNPYAGKE
ncbi:ribosome biogenesis GTPase Der [Oleispirillum naphthae]|uniref:ribosome biogenesis GTPase Der n=1 Tax=Oleispirillum naphthae TaxID=2838853 RepID=UPI0030826211